MSSSAEPYKNRTTRRPSAGPASMRSSRVYVSSTYQDLKDCRQAVRSALQRMGLDDIAMETYTAGEERPVDRCVDDVRSADIYVGVLAWRYGFVPPAQEFSITELEYRAAGEAGIPRLIFLLDPEAPWPRTAMDRDSTQIEEFRDRACDAHVCDGFMSVEDLRAKVAEAVGRYLQEWHGITAGADTEWESYCDRLIQEYGRLDLEALTPPDRDEHLQIALRDIFVEPAVREDMPGVQLPKVLQRKLDETVELPGSDLPRELHRDRGLDRDQVEQTRDFYRRQPARQAFEALTAPLARACVLLGDPGAGKSTLARYLALDLAGRRTSTTLAALEGWRPVLIELRDYAQTCDEYETFSSYLDYRKRTDGLGVTQATFESHLRGGGNVLVVFDGLDEIFDAQKRKTVSRRIVGFAAQFPSTRVVVTSRVIGYQPRIFRDAGFLQYAVQDLDNDKIDTFLRRWYELALHDRLGAVELRRERLTRAIQDSAPIRELAGNPLLLTILAIIGKHQELPRERWKVYDHAASVLVQHWDINKHLGDEGILADVIREDDKKELLRKLAIRMQEGSHGSVYAGNNLHEDDLFQHIEDYLIERFQYEPARAVTISTKMVKQLRERNFIFARYGSGVYGFVHRALLEFFSASDIVNRFEKARTLSEEELTEQFFLARSEDPSWAEVLRLIAGMVDAMVATRLVDGLLSSAGTHRSSALDRRPLASVALAAQCIAEIRNVNAATTAAESTLRAIIELIESPKRSFGDDDRETYLEKTLLPAMNAVPAWPGRVEFKDWFVQRGQYSTSSPGAKLGAQFVAALFPQDERVRELLRTNTRSSIPEQREAAILGLAQTWKYDPATIELAADGLSDEEGIVRRTSLDLLVTNWPEDDRVHDLMLHAAKDADEDVRCRAVEALAQHATKVSGAWSTVIRAVRCDAAYSVRNAAVVALASHAADPEETMRHLLQACSDPDWATRRSALRLIAARFAAKPAVFDRVLEATRDGSEDVRQTAVEMLASRWPDVPESISTVCKASRDSDPQVRRAAVRAMAQRWRDDPQAAETLKRAQTDYNGDVSVAALTAPTDPIEQEKEYVAILETVVAKDPVADARRAALETLVSEAPKSSVLALDHCIADPDPSVRLAALRSLSGEIPQLYHFRPTVLRLCEDAVEPVRQHAVEVAARLWGDRPEVVRILHRAARSQSWQLRRAALESLASRWPDSTQTRHVLRRGRRDPTGLVRYTAITATASLAQDAGERDAAVEAATTDPYVFTRRWAATLIAAQAVDADGLAGLAETAAGCSTIRETALRARARFGFDEAAMSAVRAATDDPDPDVRLAAYKIVGARRDAFPDALSVITQSSRDTDPEIRLFGLSALLAAWPSHEESSGARRRGLTDPSEKIRELALESSILHEPGTAATHRAVTAAITDSDWGTRRSAVDSLALLRRDDPATLARLHAALHHPDITVRKDVVNVLSATWRDDESTFASLADCTRDPAPRIRVQALRSLAVGWPNDSQIWGLLETARRDHDSAVTTAAWELQRGAEDNQALDDVHSTANLRHPDSVYRRLGIERLARSSSAADDATDLFRLGICDKDVGVWSRAWFLLMFADDEEWVLSVLHGTDVHPSYQARLINLQVRAARWPGSAGSCAAIRHALEDVEELIRLKALQLLMESDPEITSSLDVAVRSLSDPDWMVRSAALRLIVTCWPDDPETLDRLVSASRDYDPDNRQAALEALVIGWPRHSVTLAALTEAEADVTTSVRDFAFRTRVRLEAAPDTAEPLTANRRSAALERLREADLQRPDDPVSRRAVMDLVGSADWWIRRQALWVLARRWPDWPETDLALTRGVDDDNANVRNSVVGELTEKYPDSSAALPTLRRAARDPNWKNRANAVILLRLHRDAETRAALLAAAQDQEIHVHFPAIMGLLTGWPSDPRTDDVLRWTACSSFDVLHNLAYERLSRGTTDAVPDRESLLTARRVPDLLLLASWWGEDQEAAAVLHEHSHHHDMLRAASLSATLARSDDDPATRPLLMAAAQDECPAVRRIALEGLIRIGDPAWMSAAANDPDPYLRHTLLVFRSMVDKSPQFSSEIIEALRNNIDDPFSVWLFEIAATRASAGLLEPAELAQLTSTASYINSANIEWLQWLVRQS